MGTKSHSGNRCSPSSSWSPKSESAPDGAAVAVYEHDVQATVQLRPEDTLYLRSLDEPRALPHTPRVVHDLNTLLKISTSVSSIRSVEELQQQVVDLVADAIPAERCMLLAMPDDCSALRAVVARDTGSGAKVADPVVRTTVEHVVQRRAAVLTQDVVVAPGSGPSDGASPPKSLLCVPVTNLDTGFGVLYADVCNSASRFDEGHLQLVTAIAGVAGVALDKARHLESLERETQRLRADVDIEHSMVGESTPMRDVYAAIAKMAGTESTVLIQGESGTGKELAARALHLNSGRATKPLAARGESP